MSYFTKCMIRIMNSSNIRCIAIDTQLIVSKSYTVDEDLVVKYRKPFSGDEFIEVVFKGVTVPLTAELNCQIYKSAVGRYCELQLSKVSKALNKL